FDGLKPSSYLALVNADGYVQGFIDKITVQHGQTRNIHVTLQKTPPPTTGTITVNVMVDGRPILGPVTVNLYGRTTESQEIDRGGLVVFGNVQPGVYAIKVVSPILGSKSVGPLTIVAGQDLEQVVDLTQASPSNNGTVIVYTNTQEQYPRALANVRVTITGDAHGYTQTLQSDTQGTLIFTDVPPDYYLVEAVPLDANNEPYGEMTSNFELDAGGVVVKEFEIRGSPAPGTASLAVTVTDQQGQPISGADVSVESPLGPDVFQTDSSGVALATDLPPGELTVSASAAGYEVSDSVEVTVAVDTRDSLTIRLSPVQAPIPEPSPESSNGPHVVRLPSTGVGVVAPGPSAVIAVLLMIAAGLALAASVRLKRR
ncbi:MAG: MSCRAMM family protein, partial [Thermomicrobiales bacterium]